MSNTVSHLGDKTANTLVTLSYLGDKNREHEGHNELQAAGGLHDHDSSSESESGGTAHEGCSPHHSIGRQTHWQSAAAVPYNGSYDLACHPATCKEGIDQTYLPALCKSIAAQVFGPTAANNLVCQC